MPLQCHTQIHVHHSMQAPLFFEESGHSHEFAEGNLHMKGVLMKGQTSRDIIYHFPIGECDSFYVADLLKAAETSLDAISTPYTPSTSAHTFTADSADHHGGKTHRDAGLIFNVDLAYDTLLKSHVSDDLKPKI